MGRTPVALVVPYHDEERYLPQLIASLRAQHGASVPVVFVDNASTDGSAAIVQSCEETRCGQWTCIEEEHVGKFFAMRAAAAFCATQLRAEYVAFLDADSYCAESDWVANCVRIVEGTSSRCGYTYSPFMYFGFEHLPTFAEAYEAYQTVVNSLMERIGWTAPGMGFLCAADVLTHYFAVAQATTEIDMRLALLAVCDGRTAALNASLIRSSGRRIVVNPRNFQAWCFYDQSYYLQKDINTRAKLNLNAPMPVDDLPADMAPRFFERRALKLACRHLIPLIIFDRRGVFQERLSGVFGADVSARLVGQFGHLSEQHSFIPSERFDVIIRFIEGHPVCVDLAGHIADLIGHHYSEQRTPRAGAL